jgi:hypothetical protein
MVPFPSSFEAEPIEDEHLPAILGKSKIAGDVSALHGWTAG